MSISAIAVVLLAALTVVLAVAALRETGSPVTPTPGASALSHPPRVTASTTSQPSDARAPAVEPPLLLADQNVAYRGRSGTCLGGGTLEQTTDDGASWHSVSAPVQGILQLQALSAASVDVVGVDSGCTPALWATTNSAKSWAGPSDPAGMWFRQADTTRTLQTPSGSVPNPCRDRDVAVVELQGWTDNDAALLCQGGEVQRTVDGGQNWTE
ncbi:MAG TPA: hypothetical protein VMT27_07985, partial [Actinomycetes bacterium]|nr:hypothetical protein [Actinomycetes bacterium]